jgi:uncharacterized protein YjiS (DUF1127 family)
MTTAPIHSLTHGGIIRAAKSVISTTVAAVAAVAKMVSVVKVQRVLVTFSLAGWLMRLYCNHRSRRQLAALDSRLLADIGVSEAERRAELGKPLWKTQGSGKSRGRGR